MTQSTAAPATLSPDEPFNYEFQGWTLTQGPPSMTQKGRYVPSPSPVVQPPLQAEPFRAVPSQQINPKAPTSQNLSITALPVSVDGGKAWQVGKDAGPLSITLFVPPKCRNCNLNVHLTYVDGAPDETVNILINNAGGSNDQMDHSKPDVPLLASFEPSQLKPGPNVITISSTSNFYVNSIDIESDPDPSRILTVSYRWVAFCQSDATPQGSNTQTYSRTNGVTNTEAQQFQETLGISTSASYAGISLALTLSLSKSETHTVAVQESDTKTSSYTFTSKTDITYFQVWQVCMVYSLDGQTLYNNESDEAVPAQTRQFPM